MNFDFKVGFTKRRSFYETETRYLRNYTWAAIAVGGSALIGAGVSAYGANKQSKANQAAQDQNAALQEEQNRSAWASYLMSRGVNPAGAQTGVIPSNPQAINAKLPLWANASFSSGPKGWRKKGSGGAAAGTLGQLTYAQPVAPVSAAVAPTASKGSSKLNDILIGNPLGIGGKDRSFLDPLGIF